MNRLSVIKKLFITIAIATSTIVITHSISYKNSNSSDNLNIVQDYSNFSSIERADLVNEYYYDYIDNNRRVNWNSSNDIENEGLLEEYLEYNITDTSFSLSMPYELEVLLDEGVIRYLNTEIESLNFMLQEAYNTIETINSTAYASIRGLILYTWMVSATIDIALIATGSYAAFAGIKVLGKLFGKKMAKSFSGVVASVVSIAVSIFVNVSIGTLGNLIFDMFWAFSSLGNLVAYSLDVIFDGKNDGVIYRW